MGSLASVSNHDLFFAAIPMLLGIINSHPDPLAIQCAGDGGRRSPGAGSGYREIALHHRGLLHHDHRFIGLHQRHDRLGGTGYSAYRTDAGGSNHKRLLPVCLLLGAAYLLLIDDIARLVASVEIPIGILTAIVGAPFFIYLLNRGGKGWA